MEILKYKFTLFFEQEIIMKFIKAIIGTLFGIVLFFIWLYLLNNIQFYFFSVKELVNGTEVIGVKYPKLSSEIYTQRNEL